MQKKGKHQREVYQSVMGIGNSIMLPTSSNYLVYTAPLYIAVATFSNYFCLLFEFFFVQLDFLLIQFTAELSDIVSDLVYPNPLSILIATFVDSVCLLLDIACLVKPSCSSG